MYWEMTSNSNPLKERDTVRWTEPIYDDNGHHHDDTEVVKVELDRFSSASLCITILPHFLRDIVVVDHKGEVLFRMHRGDVTEAGGRDWTAMLAAEITD